MRKEAQIKKVREYHDPQRVARGGQGKRELERRLVQLRKEEEGLMRILM